MKTMTALLADLMHEAGNSIASPSMWFFAAAVIAILVAMSQ